ncbi:MAG: hypothetical protein RLZ82_62, partial [Actinomycetota bacterium]
VRGVSIMAENAWDLKELWNQWLVAVENRKQTQNLYV